MTGIRPAKVDKIEEGELGDIQLWSNPETWDFEHGEIPKAGDVVVITSTMNILYDIAAVDAVELRSLEINGQLTFEVGADRMLKAHNIWVRAGTLNIGTENNPFDA